MKTTTKLWTIGLAAGLAAFGILLITAGYVIGAHPESSPEYALIAATVACLGVLSTCSCLSAVMVKALQEDQRAASVLREVERRSGGGEPPGGLRLVRRDG